MKNDNTPESQASKTVPPLSASPCSALSPDVRLAALIAREIAARFYLCTDKGIGGEGGYSANFYDEDEAVEKLIEMILPLLPKLR